jgi:hypothetical protein
MQRFLAETVQLVEYLNAVAFLNMSKNTPQIKKYEDITATTPNIF